MLRRTCMCLQSVLSKSANTLSVNFSSYCSNVKTFYSVLGVEKNATDEEIKEAYYSLSKKYHPDRNIGNEFATTKILEINEAFEVLGNKIKKVEYDNKMFPKVTLRNPSKNFIYDHDVYSGAGFTTYERPVRKSKECYTTEQRYKHSKGEDKRKQRHVKQKLIFSKNISVKKMKNLCYK